MTIHLIFHTVRHLRMAQIVGQLRQRLVHSRLKVHELPTSPNKPCRWHVPPIPRYTCMAEHRFTFLNISDTFQQWDDMRHGMLWAYNLNYFDWLSQPNMTAEEGALWIDRFVERLPLLHIGLDPYPISLRGINWIKFICRFRTRLASKQVIHWDVSLYAQYRLLEKKLERHLMGNHLLEDAFSLSVGAIYFSDERMWRKSEQLLRRELAEQVMADGAHYEQSPMYHCILLDRLLDIYNFSTGNLRFGNAQTYLNSYLCDKATAMLGHLGSMLYADGTYPLFNDAALDIAPTPKAIFAYAAALGISWQPLPLGACGYRHMQAGSFEAFVDIGGIAASYQPGHSHADALNFELRIGGHPFIVDTGTSTYDKTSRRQFERSTAAHNTVTVDEHDSAEVWGGFRVGRRGHVRILTDKANEAEAQMSGVSGGLWHRRRIAIEGGSFCITDSIASGKQGTAHLHLAPNISVLSLSHREIRTPSAVIHFQGAKAVRMAAGLVSTGYNQLQHSTTIEINFEGTLETSIGLDA